MSSPGLRGTSLRHDRTVTSRFVVRTRAAVAADELFEVSLDIDAHVASMEQSGERAISGVVSGRIDLGQEVTPLRHLVHDDLADHGARPTNAVRR